ncbi:Cytochrome P450 [Cordyceps javanica]|uniref:Cytochrome P450 n=1 Tax=Cordyceps javanica TaxID=43265 RepID=A0A545UTC1_9HYPO|nr:Cytochrome P450 [Cordyceps javanica]TQW03326.1 Cytochrome P450 [Cordyceps javanica]
MVVLFLVAIIFLAILRVALRSDQLPRNIPRIPKWLSIYANYSGMPRITFFNTHVRELAEERGAVLLWHIETWSVNITEPEYLLQVFRSEKIFAKAGSYQKFPWGVAGAVFGENIIDSTGQTWKQQRDVLQPAIKRHFNIDYMKQKSLELRARLWQQHKAQNIDSVRGVKIDELVKQWALSICCHYFMGIDIEASPETNHRLLRLLMDHHIAEPPGIIHLFPVLQRVPWLTPPTRKAFRLVDEFEKAVLELARLADHRDTDRNSIMGRLKSALGEGTISEFQYRSNLKQMLLAGHEEVESVLLSALVAMAKNPQLQSALQAEMSSLSPSTYTPPDLDKLPMLLAVILETLRLYPPFPWLVNRRTTQRVCLGGSIVLPAGTVVGWNSYAVHTDARTWGPDALEFRPGRWGTQIAEINALFRLKQARATFIPFSTHSRMCLGMQFALMQLKIGLYELLRELRWSVSDETTKLRKGPLLIPEHTRFHLAVRKL